ncbi:hypothetical protein RhiirA4_449379 [Rhizophagus irregularis]|uniref:Uncharacterized protein n=1 Tax=Rhizophagus irregularis TaxID=588596 RepID=A0A2I1HJ59_9GLOM|nr:hypothetical protein RhiirA4_449379 [Rhizophagus irregularis]
MDAVNELLGYQLMKDQRASYLKCVPVTVNGKEKSFRVIGQVIIAIKMADYGDYGMSGDIGFNSLALGRYQLWFLGVDIDFDSWALDIGFDPWGVKLISALVSRPWIGHEISVTSSGRVIKFRFQISNFRH